MQAQVDIVTLKPDQEEFRGALAEVFGYQDSYMYCGDSVFATYNELHERSEQIYRRAEVVNSKLTDLKQ